MKTDRLYGYVKQHWFAIIVLFSLLLHVVVILAVRPWAQTSMGFDEQAHQEQIEKVAIRERLRKELDRERRKKIRLTPETAKQLKDKEEFRRRDLMRENVAKLMQAREQAIREREKAFEQLHTRTERELLPDEIQRFLSEMHLATHDLHQVTREGRYREESTAIKEKFKKTQSEFLELKQQADRAKAQGDDEAAAKLAKAFKKKAGKLVAVAEKTGVRMAELSEGTGGSLQGAPAVRQEECKRSARLQRPRQRALTLRRSIGPIRLSPLSPRLRLHRTLRPARAICMRRRSHWKRR